MARPQTAAAAGPAVLAVVAVHVHGARERLHRLDEPDGLLAGHAVIADRQVDVAEAELAGRLDVGRRPVDADEGPDAQLLEGRQGFGTVRVAAAIEPRAQAISILDPGDDESLRDRGRPRLLPLLSVVGPVLGARRDRHQDEDERERTDPERAVPSARFLRVLTGRLSPTARDRA